MQETVPLPDPAVQPMVHPDDIPPARELWERAWRFSLVGGGCVLFLVGAVAWSLTGTWLPPTAAVLSVGAVAWFSRRRLSEAAWDHIPRRRQDRQRPEPGRRFVVTHLVDAAALGGGAVTLAWWADRTGQGPGLRAWFLWAGAVLVLVVAARAVVLARTAVRSRPGAAHGRGPASQAGGQARGTGRMTP